MSLMSARDDRNQKLVVVSLRRASEYAGSRSISTTVLPPLISSVTLISSSPPFSPSLFPFPFLSLSNTSPHFQRGYILELVPTMWPPRIDPSIIVTDPRPALLETIIEVDVGVSHYWYLLHSRYLYFPTSIGYIYTYIYTYTCVDIIYDVCVADENDIQDTVEDHDSGFEGSYARSRYKCHHGR